MVVVDLAVVINEGRTFGWVNGGELQCVSPRVPNTVQECGRGGEITSVGTRIGVGGKGCAIDIDRGYGEMTTIPM